MAVFNADKAEDMSNPGKNRIGNRLTKRPLGRILVDAGFITEEKLCTALEEQHRTNELLGEILVRLGEIDPTELNIALSLQKDLATPENAVKTAGGVRKMLGEILLEARKIVPEQLETALDEQKKTGEKLGQTLVRLGLLTRREVETALAIQNNQSDARSAPSRLRLGELLIAAGYITRKQLDDALNRQGISKKKLGEILIEAGYVDPAKLKRGLRLQEMLVSAALAAALSLSPASTARAQQQMQLASAKVSVNAVVRAHTSLRILRQPAELIVTEADVRRGFIDVVAGSLIELNNNSPAGFLLTFEAHGLPYKEAVVKGIGRDVVVGPNGGILMQAMKGTVTTALSYRFVLAEDAQPGTYEWPFTLSINPL